MKSTTKIHLIAVWLLSLSMLTNAADKKVCAYSLPSGASTAYLSFETDRYGDVVITLENGSNTTGVAFRGNGLGSKLNCFWVQVTGQPNDSACHYFERQMVSGSNVFRLHLLEGKTLPVGAVIYYDGKSSVEWKCDQNNNAYNSNKTFYHTYGTTCATLDAPVLNSLDANYVLDFSSVAGADYYTVSFYSGRDCVYSGTVAVDKSTSFRPFFTDTYEIVVQAWTNSGLYSNESNKLMKELTGDPKYLPASEVCDMPFMQNKDEGTRFLLVAETDEQGAIILTAMAGDGGDESLTMFRNNGLREEGLKFHGEALSQYFTKKLSKDNKSVVLTPIAGKNPPKGRLLTYNEYGEDQNAEWKTSQKSNAYSSDIHFAYRYGTVCPQLATPVITAITDSVPIFQPIEGADEYVAQVYLNSQLKYKQTIQQGDQLHFVPDQTATYQVSLTAYGEGVKHSEESAKADWILTKKEIEVGESEYCNFKSGSAADPFSISFETLANGDVEITISGDAKTAFRGNGMGDDLGAFKVGSLGAGQFFEKMFMGTGALTYTLHVKDPNYLPAKGDKIVFNGTVAYVTANNSNAYGTYTYTYTYGSVCDHLETPVITSLQADGSWTLDHPIEGADAYRMMVYRDGFLMQDSLMQLGELLTFSPWHNFIYLVYVQAVSSQQVMNSALSVPYEWKVKATDKELPISSVCNKYAYNEATCGKIYVTAITDEQGRVVFTIDNDSHTIRFRANGFSKLIFINDDVTSFFTRTIVEPDSTTMILTPLKTAAGMIYSGDPLINMGSLEWISDCNTNGYTSFPFTYLYGTDCTPRLTRLDRPSVTAISPEGDIQFEEVDSAYSYLMQVLDGDQGLLSESPVAQGERISRYYVILPDFEYYVRLQAWPEVGSEVYRESLWSDSYLWKPSELPTGIKNAECRMHNAQCLPDGKYIINGQLVIICNGIRYNAQGSRL